MSRLIKLVNLLPMQPTLSYLFINPPASQGRKIIRNIDCATESKGNYLYQPYDFLLLSSQLKSAEFKLIDAIAEGLSKDDLLNTLPSSKMFIVALADANWDEDFQFVEVLRSRYPQVPIIVFGDAFLDPEAVTKIKPYVNGVMANPIEIDLKGMEFLSPDDWVADDGFVKDVDSTWSYSKKPKKISISIPKHEKFLHPSYRWPFSMHKRYTTIFTSWGCPYSCSYCSLSKFPNFYREAKEVLSELEYVHALGIKELYFGDQSFGVQRDNTVKLLLGMIDKNFNFSWTAYLHPNQYEADLLNLMKKAGCHTIMTGIETYNLQSLSSFGRNIKEDQLNSLLEHSKKIKLSICGDFIIGLPGENKDDILKTVQFAKKIDLDYASFNIAAPHAGSSLRELAREEGRWTENNSTHFDSFGGSKILGNKELTSEEILLLRNHAVREFYFRPTYLLKRLLRITSLEHLLIQLGEMVQIFNKSR